MREIFFSLFLTLTVLHVNAQGFKTIKTNYKGYGTLYSNYNAYWEYWVPAGTMGVLTFKNSSGSLKYEIYEDHKLNIRTKSGYLSKDKTLVTLPEKNYGRTVFIRIKNYGQSAASYNMYVHKVDFGQVLANALIDAGIKYLSKEFIKWIFGIEDNNQSEQKDAERAADVVVAIVRQKDLGEASYDIMKNEILRNVRSELGYGGIADFAIDYSLSVLKESYKYYFTSNTLGSMYGNNTLESSPSYSSASDRVMAENTVKYFIQDLGNGNFQSAYARCNNPAWGTYSHFSSKNGFGGINRTKINEIYIEDISSSSATIYADIYAYDPYNDNGRYKEYYYLKKSSNKWKIVKMKVIKASMF